MKSNLQADQHHPSLDDREHYATTVSEMSYGHVQGHLSWNIFGLFVATFVAGCFALGTFVWWRLLS